MPFRLECNRFGGGSPCLYLRRYTLQKLTLHNLTNDLDEIFVEINLRKVKWIWSGTCHSPQQLAEYILTQVNHTSYNFIQIYDKFILAGDFNLHEADQMLSEFLYKNDFKNLVWQSLCKKPLKPELCWCFFHQSFWQFPKYNNFSKWFTRFTGNAINCIKDYFSKGAT